MEPTLITPAGAPAQTIALPAEQHSATDWSAILAGAVVSAGVTSIFATFGVAVGLATISPYDGDGSAFAELLALALWAVWTAVSSVMVGAYIAGRMRRRAGTVSADEISVRDGIHGLAVWGAALILGAWLVGSGIGAAVDAAVQMPDEMMSTAADSATTTDATAESATATTQTQAAIAAPTKEQLEMARKYSVVSAFVTAASLLIAAAGAYWAAGMGGRHRDENRVFVRFGAWT